MIAKFPIFVRPYGGTYIARSEGKQASCTSGEDQAANAVAVKVAAGRQHSVYKVSSALYYAHVEVPE